MNRPLHHQADGNAEQESQRDIDRQHVQRIVYRAHGGQLVEALTGHLRHAVLLKQLPSLLRGYQFGELPHQEAVVHVGKIEILGNGEEHTAIEEHEDSVGIASAEGYQTLAPKVTELAQPFANEKRRIDNQHHGGQAEELILHTYYI